MKHPPSLTPLIFAICLAAALSARTARGQSGRKLELHVIDSVSGAPVERAEIRILKTIKDTAGWMIRITTDSTGRAIVAAPDDEQLLMMVRRLGFESSFFPVSPSDSDDVLVVALAPAAVHLAATVTRATATNQALTEVGFYERKRIRPGVFLDSAAIAKLKPIDFVSVIRQYLTTCTMIYMNGMPLLYLRDVDIRRVVGIEVYASNQQAPPQFSNSMDSEQRCGTIVVWQGF